MGNHIVVMEFTHASGLPKDKVTNTFAFQTTDASIATGSQQDALLDEVGGFYNNGGTTDTQIASWLGLQLVRSANGMTAKLYDVTEHLDGSPHGSPIRTKSYTLSGLPGATALPEEVALCITLRGTGATSAAVEAPDSFDPGSAVDRPRQRRSGRLYLGPLTPGSITTSGSTARPHANLLAAIAFRAPAFADAVQLLGHNWATWSRVDSAMRNVVQVEVDNAFDTQRRRGASVTSRAVTLTP